jgi:hypothetical protein
LERSSMPAATLVRSSGSENPTVGTTLTGTLVWPLGPSLPAYAVQWAPDHAQELNELVAILCDGSAVVGSEMAAVLPGRA